MSSIFWAKVNSIVRPPFLIRMTLLRPLQIRLGRTVPLVSPSLEGRGKGEGGIHPHPSLPHPGVGNFGCNFFRVLVIVIKTLYGGGRGDTSGNVARRGNFHLRH